MLGHWLNFGYADQLEMDASVWIMFIDEAVKMSERNGNIS